MTQTIGQRLKQIREEQDISLEEIAHKTRIRLGYLEALEEDDIDSLPSATHMRGFLRLYASELGVAIEDLDQESAPSIKDTENKSSSFPAEEEAATIEEIPEPQQPTQDNQETIDSPEGDQTPPQEELSEIKKQTQPQDIVTDVEEQPPLINPKSQTADEIFKAIGEKLKKRRQLLSLSIDDIHENIHVRKSYLTLIEAGQFGNLPSLVQAKGMLQNYASFLNLDVDTLLLNFSDALQSQHRENQSFQAKSRSSAKEVSSTSLQIRNFFSLDLLVILTLFIVFASFVVWGVNRILTVDSPAGGNSEMPGVSDILLAPGTPVPDLTLTPEEPEPGQVVEEVIQEEEPPLFDPVTSTDPINIIIIPRQRVWVQVTADETQVFEGRLLPGNVYDYSGQETIDVLVANAGAVQIFFNDQDLGTPGLHGELVNLAFTTTGLVQPAPTITPTMVPTPEATPTPTETPIPVEENDQTD